MGWGLVIATVALMVSPELRARPETVELARINGPIGPATAGYVARAIRRAAADGAQCLIVQLDTPGGLLDSTKEIVQSFYAAPLPVIVFVAPAGATAGSAGCFIALAADVAAMAPNTSIGAAHPVTLGDPGPAQGDAVWKQKLENFAASFIESIAAKRNRNVEWAKSAVRESASITAEEALEKKVIDLLAKDVPDLLGRLEGREVSGHTLRTVNVQVVELPMLARERVFQALWRPEVVFLLMMIALYGILGELSNPGAILPGVVGAIALILALYMGSVLPVNIAGVALLVLAIGLFIVDVFAPTHGVLTVGGVISFFLGALMLFDRSETGFRLPLSYVVPATVVTAAFFTFVVGAGLRAQFLPVKAGPETMTGKTAQTLAPIDPLGGLVLLDGEYWNAVSETPIEAGRRVEILSLTGLTLKVKPKT